MRTETNWIASSLGIFQQYKNMAEKAMHQINDDGFFYAPNPESNSIAIIVKHLAGNMKSRWTNFLTEDGEKSWRHRDNEFDLFPTDTRISLMQDWEAGWLCLIQTLSALQQNDLNKIITIRHEAHSVVEAINRQIAHYSYHIGQIVYLAKLYQANQWQTLSIAKGQSESYNQTKFKS